MRFKTTFTESGMYSEFDTKEVRGGKVQNKKSKSNLIIPVV